LKDLGVVRIYPKHDVTKHRLPENVEPDMGTYVLAALKEKKETEAQKYQKALAAYPLQAYDFGTNDLAKAISDDCKPRTAALIIVHMTGDRPDDETVGRQAAAVEAAEKKGIPIFNTQRRNGRLLTQQLKVKLKTEKPIFASRFGNALLARDDKNRPVGNILLKRCHTAIVLGMELGQCVDSTILGQWDRDDYLPGLLDLGIMVVTARNVLLPTDEVPSSYFDFDVVEQRYGVRSVDTQAAHSTGGNMGVLVPAANPALESTLRWAKGRGK
jgi:hypothetical protein